MVVVPEGEAMKVEQIGNELVEEIVGGLPISEPLTATQAKEIAGLLGPLIRSQPIDFKDKVLCCFVRMDGPFKDEILNRMYCYADFIRNLGARSVLFLPLGTMLGVTPINPGDLVELRFQGRIPTDSELERCREYLRVAGNGQAGVVITTDSVSIDVRPNRIEGEQNGYSEIVHTA